MKTIHFHSKRGCLSYITYNDETKEAALIDPSEEISNQEYLNFLEDNNIKLKYIIETHTHADHISSANSIREITGAKIVRHELAPSKLTDIKVLHDQDLNLGDEKLKIIYTPGHTNESISIYNGSEVFTGDTLLIGGTGRTDFQIGNSEDLYESIHEKIEGLPNDTILRPGHDYKNKNSSILSDELHTSERLQLCKESFINTMDNHHPPKPELFEESINKNSQ